MHKLRISQLCVSSAVIIQQFCEDNPYTCYFLCLMFFQSKYLTVILGHTAFFQKEDNPDYKNYTPQKCFYWTKLLLVCEQKLIPCFYFDGMPGKKPSLYLGRSCNNVRIFYPWNCTSHSERNIANAQRKLVMFP